MMLEKGVQRFTCFCITGVGSEDGDDLPEHDPCPDFRPIIPLPDEIVPTTGEEGETVCSC